MYYEKYHASNYPNKIELLKERIGIPITCNSITYNQLLKKYKYVSGITGTLDYPDYILNDLYESLKLYGGYFINQSVLGKNFDIGDNKRHQINIIKSDKSIDDESINDTRSITLE